MDRRDNIFGEATEIGVSKFPTKQTPSKCTTAFFSPSPFLSPIKSLLYYGTLQSYTYVENQINEN